MELKYNTFPDTVQAFDKKGLEEHLDSLVSLSELKGFTPERINLLSRVYYGTPEQVYISIELWAEKNNINLDKGENLFTFFKRPIFNIYPYKSISLLQVYELIKSPHYKNKTEKLRSIKDPKEARQYKAKSFDYVTFGGQFELREESKIIERSGFICIDLDHLENLGVIREKLQSDSLTALLFTSPSGDGLKWVIPVNIEKYSHADSFKGLKGYLKKKYDLEIDASGADVCRACFLPHDENIFINPKYLNDGRI